MFIQHYIRMRDCANIALMFPGEEWALALAFFCEDDHILDCLEDMSDIRVYGET